MKLHKSKFLLIGLLLTLFSSAAFAGTGGAELSTWYTDISDALTGTWGRINELAGKWYNRKGDCSC